MNDNLDRLVTDNEELEHLYYVDDSCIHGRGLFARTEIQQGEYLGTYEGPEVSENGSHVLWIESDVGIWVGRDGTNLLRFINHALVPLAEFYGFDLYALKHISMGDEITINYGEEPDADASD